LPDEGRAFIYKQPLVGMCKLKVQIHNRPKDFVKKIKKAKHHLVKSKKKDRRRIYSVSEGKGKAARRRYLSLYKVASTPL
jgi:hypothetical protein